MSRLSGRETILKGRYKDEKMCGKKDGKAPHIRHSPAFPKRGKIVIDEAVAINPDAKRQSMHLLTTQEQHACLHKCSGQQNTAQKKYSRSAQQLNAIQCNGGTATVGTSD